MRSPFNGRIGARPLQKQTQRARGMAVRVSFFSRHQQLQAAEEGTGDFRLSGQAGVFENQHAPLRFFGGQQRSRLEQMRANRGVFPVDRPGSRLRRAGDEAAHALPKRREMLLANFIVERFSRVQCLSRWRARRRFHGPHPSLRSTGPVRPRVYTCLPARSSAKSCFARGRYDAAVSKIAGRRRSPGAKTEISAPGSRGGTRGGAFAAAIASDWNFDPV